jgi:hypothetical protein
MREFQDNETYAKIFFLTYLMCLIVVLVFILHTIKESLDTQVNTTIYYNDLIDQEDLNAE